MIIRQDGSWCGLISGGCLEADIAAHAAQCFESIEPKILNYNTTDDGDTIFGTGLGCKGTLTIVLVSVSANESPQERLNEVLALHHFSEYVSKDAHESPHLILFGAGVDARPLCAWAKELDWRVSVVDPRAAFAKPENFPTADHVLCAHVGDAVVHDLFHTRQYPFAVIMTHNINRDLAILQSLAAHHCAYIGLLGPRSRTAEIIALLTDEESAAILPVLHAPIGLDLGGYGPEAIALAILSELQKRRFRGTGQSRPWKVPSSKTEAIVLAAGTSSRMGQPKQLLKINGQSLVRHTITTAFAAGIERITVVLGAYAGEVLEEIRDLPVRIAINADFATGIASSIRAGINQLEETCEEALILTCDQTLVSAEDLRCLVAKYNRFKPMICASSYGDVIGIPAIFSRTLFRELRELQGDRGARSLIQKYADETIAQQCARAVFDCDTPGDFAALCEDMTVRKSGTLAPSSQICHNAE